ncbi:hypothetical protein PSV08DRAFT_353927 [Bipolaris maydis]|uniref:uncharacterized protein n=1 Tax=Cochliobolus heterostrophus TaxID=5016 RepID=UPI0024D96D1C|nr:hypothetical protein PSV08DRAFT_353927 [Bipolaris maydis]
MVDQITINSPEIFTPLHFVEEEELVAGSDTENNNNSSDDKLAIFPIGCGQPWVWDWKKKMWLPDLFSASVAQSEGRGTKCQCTNDELAKDKNKAKASL